MATESEFLTHPEAHEALAISALERAHNLSQAVFALKHEAIHGSPPGLNDAQKASRKAILAAARSIVTAARNREVEKFFDQWSKFMSWASHHPDYS